MGHEIDRRRSAKPAKEWPVRPGTPLHRLLELIAREVAKELEDDRPEPGKAGPEE
jgi:hypothetical protein